MNADEQQAARYETWLLALMELESVAAIKANALNGPGLGDVVSRAATQRLRQRATSAGSTAQLRLLEHVLTIVASARAAAGAQARSDGLGLPRQVQLLRERLAEAHHQPTLLAALRALGRDSAGVPAEVYDEVLDSPDADPRAIELIYLQATRARLDSVRVAALLRLAGVLWPRGEVALVHKRLRRAVELARRTADAALLFQACSSYASVLGVTGHTERAAEMYEEALAAASVRYNRPGMDVATLPMRRNLAVLYRDLGRFKDARRVVDAVLNSLVQYRDSVRVVLTGGGSRDESEGAGTAWDSIGATRLGSTFSELLEWSRRFSLVKGLLLQDEGEYDEADVTFGAVAADALAQDDRDVAFEAMTARAALAMTRGDSRQADRQHRRLTGAAEQWGDHAKLTAAYNNFGAALLHFDRPSEAFRAYVTALWHAGEAGSPARSSGIALIGIGDSFERLGSQSAAQASYQEAFDRAVAANDAAVVFQLLMRAVRTPGRLTDDQLPYLEALWGRAQNLTNMEIWALTVTLADHAVSVGRPHEAVRMLTQALDDVTRRDEDAREVVLLKHRLGVVLADHTDRLREGFETLTLLLESEESRVRRTPPGRRVSELVEEMTQTYGAVLRLLTERREALMRSGLSADPDDVLSLQERAKSRLLAVHLGRGSLAPPADVPPGRTAREAELLAVESSLIAGGAGAAGPDPARLREVHHQLRQCWQEIGRHSPEYARLRLGEPVRVEDLHDLLASCPGTAFLSFFCDDEGTSVVALRAGEPAVSTRLPVGKTYWAAAAASIRKAFNGVPNEWPPFGAIRRDKPWRRKLPLLDEVSRLLMPVFEDLAGVDHVCVAPHGPLHLVPFHAMRGADGRYLVEHLGISYTPSLTSAVNVLHRARLHQEHGSALVLGVAGADDVHPGYFEGDEDLLSGGPFAVDVMSGPGGASRANAIRALPHYDLLHLTCHGFYDSADPLRSGLLLSDGVERPPRDPRGLPINRRARMVLTAADVMKCRLHADLVAMRACVTAMQEDQHAGDDFEGVTRSFLFAGANSVLASLWNVDQQSSRQLVASFYRHWVEGTHVPKWRALQLSMLEMLRSADVDYLSHPYHWAPFVLVGDWT
jgi:tetratricopeptide (TPR) repeat protein